jgi:hypothetical protein
LLGAGALCGRTGGRASGRYERLFPELRALEGEDEALLALGRAGGVCDGGDSCTDAIETAAGWPQAGV